MPDCSTGTARWRWYLGLSVMTATPCVVRVALGASWDVWKMSARGSLERSTSS